MLIKNNTFIETKVSEREMVKNYIGKTYYYYDYYLFKKKI